MKTAVYAGCAELYAYKSGSYRIVHEQIGRNGCLSLLQSDLYKENIVLGVVHFGIT